MFAPPGRAAETRERVERAKKWLIAAVPLTAEDRNLKLLGLKWGGLSDAELRPYATAILKDQRADGGWAQRAELTSDAYATGQTLFALATAGGSTTRDRGVSEEARNTCCRRSARDGSWYVRSRCVKIPAVFESGFPVRSRSVDFGDGYGLGDDGADHGDRCAGLIDVAGAIAPDVDPGPAYGRPGFFLGSGTSARGSRRGSCSPR